MSETARLRTIGLLVAAGALRAAGAEAVKGPGPETLLEFEQHVRLVEAKIDAGGLRYLWADTPDKRAKLRRGEVAVTPAATNRQATKPVTGGLIHDWSGAVFVDKVGLERVLAFMRDYDRHQEFYKPEVVSSRLIDNRGDQFTVALRLRKRKATVEAVLDTVHEVVYQRLAAERWQSRSRSTRISEIRHPGGPREEVLPPGKDRGFLWRLNSYWKFTAADGGVYIECEAISLTRSIPKPVTVLVPVVRDLPREALETTLRATRNALTAPVGRKR